MKILIPMNVNVWTAAFTLILFTLGSTIVTAQNLAGRINPVDQMEMVWIPAGSFQMGCSEEEIPCPGKDSLQNVTLERGFWMAVREVSVEQYLRFADATGYQTDAEKSRNPRTFRQPGFEQAPDEPAVYISGNDAQAYARWAGGRLPFEPEWEYACRAGTRTRFYWGSEIDANYTWYRENSMDGTKPVGTLLPNAWGLFDMIGNVWEWCEARKDRNYTIKTDTATRVLLIRGGSWATCPWLMRASLAHPYLADFNQSSNTDETGFRYVLDSVE